MQSKNITHQLYLKIYLDQNIMSKSIYNSVNSIAEKVTSEERTTRNNKKYENFI